MKTIYKLLLIYVVIFLNASVVFSQETKTSNIVDSVYSYLDSVPEIRNIVCKDLTKWKQNPQKIYFYNEEYATLKIHLKYSLLPNCSYNERINKTLNLLHYKLSELVTQFNTKLRTKDEIKEVFNQIVDSSHYKNNACILDSYWANTDKIVVLIGQIHSSQFTEKENKLVTKVQEEIYNVQDSLYNYGFDLLIEEGFPIREIDSHIPTKMTKAEICKDIEKKMTLKFDSLHNAIVYGFENFSIYNQRCDSLKKIQTMLEFFAINDSIKFPIKTDKFIASFNLYVINNYNTFPIQNYMNLDTAKMYRIISEKLKNEKPIELMKFRTIWNKQFCEAYKVILNERNEMLVSSILDIYKYTNKQMAMLKIGSGHLDGRVNDLAIVGFGDKLKTVQSFCKKEGISYVYILTNTQIKRLFN